MFLRLSHNMEEACLPQKISINSIPKSNSMSILTTEEDEQFDQELLDISQDISSPKSTVKLIQIQLKKDFFQINQTMVSKEYEDIFTSKRNERNAFLLGEKINKKRKSIWKKHIEKEMKAVNQALRKSLKSKNSISNECDQTCSFSILRILESNANEMNSNRYRSCSINYQMNKPSLIVNMGLRKSIR